MVDLSNVQRNISTNKDNLAAAVAGSYKAEIEKKKSTKRVTPARGLGLENLPDTKNYVNVEDASATAETTDVSSVLDQIDTDLQQVQALLKNFIARKLQLADKHEDKRHELLISAFDDCKNAYTKIKEVRENIS
jgi:hypothetical protein